MLDLGTTSMTWSGPPLCHPLVIRALRHRRFFSPVPLCRPRRSVAVGQLRAQGAGRLVHGPPMDEPMENQEVALTPPVAAPPVGLRVLAAIVFA